METTEADIERELDKLLDGKKIPAARADRQIAAVQALSLTLIAIRMAKIEEHMRRME